MTAAHEAGGAPLRAAAALQGPVWLVGGAVRDRLLDRATADFDLVVGGDVPSAARALARAAAGHPFELSEAFGAWRVVARDRSWQVDLMALDGTSIEEDLGRRDLTVNAIAQRLPLADDTYVDPFGGRDDLAAATLRAVSGSAFTADPLRVMRLARMAAQLGFAVDPGTARLAGAAAGGLGAVAAERVFAELKLIVGSDRALEGLAVMDRTGATAVVLPELTALGGVSQSRFHHLDVGGHTREVLEQTIALERDPSPLCATEAEQAALRAVLDAPLANELTRGQALRFGALLHDIAKPQTRGVAGSGRVTFMGHDTEGAQLAADILGRLRASERLREYVAALTRHHLRLGFLVHQMPLTRRAIYDYLAACAPVAVDVTLLSVADRLATRGDNAERAIALHLELARQLLGEALAWAADPPRPPVRGDELVRALGIAPGPVVGGLLAELEAASFSGELSSAEEAIVHARRLIAEDAS